MTLSRLSLEEMRIVIGGDTLCQSLEDKLPTRYVYYLVPIYPSGIVKLNWYTKSTRNLNACSQIPAIPSSSTMCAI